MLGFSSATPNPYGVRMMFKIIKYRNLFGKIQSTIETDDQMAADFCRFFGSVNKFLDLFHNRLRAAKGSDLYQNSSPQNGTIEKGICRAAGPVPEHAGYPDRSYAHPEGNPGFQWRTGHIVPD